MRVCLFCFSDRGSELALRLCEELGIRPKQVHSIPKFASRYGFSAHGSVCADMGELFNGNDALIFIGACGIAVRDIAPHLRNKTVDPAVLVIDDQGRFVIPILSGHIGGANALAQRIAKTIGATAVVTTATDNAGRFSCDAWASAHNCAISSMRLAKDISAAILTQDIPISSEFELPPVLPDGLKRQEDGECGIFIGIHKRGPYTRTLNLIPRIVTVGVGCRRGTNGDAIFKAVEEALSQNGMDMRSVCQIATIDVKRDEQGLLDLAKRLDVPVLYYSAEELNAVVGTFSESEFVRRTVGAGNVCERAAALAGGRLVVGKSAKDGVTTALSVKEWGIEF